MDNVTHALAGGVLAALTLSYVERKAGAPSSEQRRASLGRAFALVGVITAELPDADVFYAGALTGSPILGNLLHHRGHTHTVVFAIVGALAVWAAALALRKELRAPHVRTAMLALALAGTLSHIALDYTNSYGVHPFWPFDNRWFYGDAIFIVEPWLWVAAIPPLLLMVRGTLWRALLGAALAAILVASWSVNLVERGAAIAITSGVIAWFALLRTALVRHRVAAAALAWVAVEAVFFASTLSARSRLRVAFGDSYRDAALTPFVGDPLCVRGLVVSVSGDSYRVTETTVAAFPSIRRASECGQSRGENVLPADTTMVQGEPARRASTASFMWGREWVQSRAELSALAASRCEIAAALQFVRVPSWFRLPDGRTRLFDLRYAGGRGGWASVDASERPARCPNQLPGWTPPREDLIAGVP